MPAASEQISAGGAPIHFAGAAIQAAHCRLFAHRQPMSHRAPCRNEGRNLEHGRFPLSAVFRYSVGLPDKSTNVPGRVMTTARNGAPLIVWQSVQLQMVVVSGSASASNVTYPQ